MSRGVIIAIIIVILAGLGIWYLSYGRNADVSPDQSPNTQDNQPNPVSTNPSVVEVKYTDTGFVPAEVKIRPGGVARFKNESTKMMWVASAPHPQHTDYPEFDADKGYGTGETYSFTFTRTGTWKFHNHLAPTRFGRVTVE